MYQNILVPVDLSDEHSWRKALPTAVRLAQAFDATLHLITVLPGFQMPLVGQHFPTDFEPKIQDQAAEQLKAFQENHVPDDVACERMIATGKIYLEILHAASAVKAGLIVMGSHRPELADFLIGPNAQKVVQHADCSVMVVRE